MLWPLLRMLMRTYGISMAKTVFQAALKTLERRTQTGSGYSQEYIANKIRGAAASAPVRMSAEEAVKVLRLPLRYSKQDVETQFDKYFTANDAVKGGSFYLQCKFLAAKETLLDDLKSRETESR